VPAGKFLPKNTHRWPGIEEYNIAARPNWLQQRDVGSSDWKMAERIPDSSEGRRDYA
jgi:hypothetical protein